METLMPNTIFDFNAFTKITQQLMHASPERARAVMVENNAYYLLVNMHIQLCNMVEFADQHDSELEPLIDDLKVEVERIQQVKGARWLDDFMRIHRGQ
jgi:hypothetical protein